MKNLLFLAVTSFLLTLSACSSTARIDASSEERFKSSYEAVENSLPSEDRSKFKESADLLLLDEMFSSGGENSIWKGPDEKILKRLDGKTGKEIIAEAELIEEDMQRKLEAYANKMKNEFNSLAENIFGEGLAETQQRLQALGERINDKYGDELQEIGENITKEITKGLGEFFKGLSGESGTGLWGDLGETFGKIGKDIGKELEDMDLNESIEGWEESMEEMRKNLDGQIKEFEKEFDRKRKEMEENPDFKQKQKEFEEKMEKMKKDMEEQMEKRQKEFEDKKKEEGIKI